MKNRAIQVKMVKTNEGYEPYQGSQPSQPVAHDYSAIVQEVLTGVAASVIIYMGADTIRQSILHIVRTKIT